MTYLYVLMISFTPTQVNQSDENDQDFGEYELDYMAGEKTKASMLANFHHCYSYIIIKIIKITLNPRVFVVSVRFSFHAGEQSVSSSTATFSRMCYSPPHPSAGLL